MNGRNSSGCRKAELTDKRFSGSYAQVLHASSIVGGAQVFNYLVAMLRTKLVAMLLGPSGVGLVGLYQSSIGLVESVSNFGIASSGVREVARAVGEGDGSSLSRTIRVVRRACWATGAFGWILAAAGSYPLSVWAFSSSKHAGALALLGSTILLGALVGGENAALQGTRRIGDLARTSLIYSLVNTAAAVGIYGWVGQRGIVPVLVLAAGIQLAVTRRFSRRIPLAPVRVDTATTLAIGRSLASLGVAFMVNNILVAASDAFIRGSIARRLGVDAAGQYQAAWTISGMFAGFVLDAMSKDYYPRLTAAAADDRRMAQMVNEQTEIGVLLALPGLVFTVLFAPYVIRIIYTSGFLPCAQLLPWFLVGIFGRVVSWPLTYVQLAKGASRWYITTESVLKIAHVGAAFGLMARYGLVGVAYAFVLLYAVSIVAARWVAGRLIGFAWSREVLQLAIPSAAIMAAALLVPRFLAGLSFFVVSALVAVVSSVYCLRELAARLGPNHRLSRAAVSVPGWRRIAKRK